ncbi:MAG: asparagine synthase [Burkholderiales bacterium]|nr:asparagine synthase [Burkholderiales bacterium]
MFRFRGSIRFAELGEPASAAATLDRGTNRLTLPGLDLAWDPRHASVARESHILALASGRPRIAGMGAGRDAARWIELYRRDGEHAAAEVGGGFAAAVVDIARQRALLFVDRFSMEAMCYRAHPGGLAFSDSCEEVPGASREIDAQALYDYLYFHVIPSPATVFRDVRRLEPAHVVVADTAGTRAQCYWTPAFEEHDRRHLSQRMRAFVDAVRTSVVEEADDPRTACFLSGGTDSSTIAGMLTRVRNEPAHAYSIGFESAGYDEMEYARIAARELGLAHHAYYVTPDDLVSAIPGVAASFDQPFGNSSVLPAYVCALRAREDGFTRMLAGDGGDELYGGNSRYATQKMFELYHALPDWVRHAVLEPPMTRWALFRKVPGLRHAGGYVRHARIQMPERLETFNLMRRIGHTEMLAPPLSAAIDADRPGAHQRSVWNASRGASLVNRMLAYDWKFTLADSDLPKVRAATRLAGVTVGYPFLSRELTDLSLGLPPDWKVNGTRLRWFFKQALRDVLPRQIRTKKKHGFGLPFGAWCLRHPPLRKLAEDSLAGIVERDIIRGEFARDLMVQRLPEAPGYYGEMVWILMMLEQWLRSRQQGVGVRP